MIEALRIKYGRMPEEEPTDDDDSLSSEDYIADDEREAKVEKPKRNKKRLFSPKEVFPGMYYNQTSQTCEQYHYAKEPLRVANPDPSSEEDAAKDDESNGNINPPGSKSVSDGIVPTTPENNRTAVFELSPLNDTNQGSKLLPTRDSKEGTSAEATHKNTRHIAFIEPERPSRQREVDETGNKIHRTKSTQEMNRRDPLYGYPRLPDATNGGHQFGYHANTRNPPPALEYHSSAVVAGVRQLYLTPLAIQSRNPGKIPIVLDITTGYHADLAMIVRYEGRIASTSGYIETTPSQNAGNGEFPRVSPLQAPPHAQAMVQRAATLAIRQRTVAPELQQAKHIVEWMKDVPVGGSPETNDNDDQAGDA